MVTALPRADVALLMIKIRQKTMAAALLPVPSLTTSKTETLCHFISWANGTKGRRATYLVTLCVIAATSVIEYPKTIIQTTPTMNWDRMTSNIILGNKILRRGNPSARWAGPSKPISMPKLLTNPSKTARLFEVYLFLILDLSSLLMLIGFLIYPVSLFTWTNTDFESAFGALTRRAIV